MTNQNYEDFKIHLECLNLDFMAKLDEVSRYYNSEIIDSNTFLLFSQIDSLPQIMSHFNEDINNKLSVLSVAINLMYLKPNNLEKKTNLHLQIPHCKQSNQSNEIKSTACKGQKKIFEITKEKGSQRKADYLKYLHKRIRNALGSYIISEINTILKQGQGKILPRNFKLLHQSSISRSFICMLELRTIDLMPRQLIFDLFTQVSPSQFEPLNLALNRQVKSFFQDYMNSEQYLKDMKLMESQVGTNNLKLLLGDIRKHLRLIVN